MTKKRRSLFIVLGVVCVCVLSCAFVLTGCGKKHKFSSDDWTYDETGHWHACTKHDDCGETDGFEAHTPDYDNGVVTTPATCGSAGVMTYTCTVCGYDKITDTIPATGEHTLSTHVEAKDADCMTGTAGNIEYWQCSVCEKYFSDSEGKNEISLSETVITAAHTYSEDSETDWTWTGSDTDGYTAATVTVACDECGTVSDPVTASVTSITADGVTTYTATATVGGVVFTDTKEVEASSGVPATPAVKEITLSQTALTLTLGANGSATGTITATVSMSDGSPYEGDVTITTVEGVTFTQSNANGTVTITVTASAAVTETEVTVSAGEQSAKFTLTVNAYVAPEKVYEVIVNTPTNTVLEAGENLTLTWTVTVDGVADSSATVTWTSSDGAIATVTDGVVTAKKAGTVTITATSTDDTTKYGSVTITVIDATKVFEITEADEQYLVYGTSGEAFENQSDVTVTRIDGEDGVTYLVSGTATLFDEAAATAFGGAAKYGDSYVVIKILVKVGESVTITDSDEPRTLTNENGKGDFDGNYLYVISRVSGTNSEGKVLSAAPVTYTVSDGTAFTVAFDLEIGPVFAVTEADEQYLIYDTENQAAFENQSDVAIKRTVDENGNVTYTVSGTASELDTDSAYAFDPSGNTAKAGDEYVVVKVYVKIGDSITITDSDEPRTLENTDGQGDFDGNYLYLIMRISGTNESGKVLNGNPVEFTITSAGSSASTSFTVAFDLPIGPVLAVTEDDAPYLEYANGEYFVNQGDVEVTRTVDGNGEITYTVSGTATLFTEASAAAFNGDGTDAKANDAYVVVKIYVGIGNTISFTDRNGDHRWTNTDGSGNFDGDYLYLIMRISGTTENGTVLDGSPIEFTITSPTEDEGEPEEVAKFTIAFNLTIDSVYGITEADDEYLGYEIEGDKKGYFANEADVEIERTVDGDGNAVYTVSGTASIFDETSAAALDSTGEIQAGDAYIVLKILVREGETISFTDKNGDHEWKNENGTGNFDGEWLYLVVRISGITKSGLILNAADMVFTITGTESTTKTFTVSFAGVTGIPELERVEVPGADSTSFDTFEGNNNITIEKTKNDDGSTTYVLTGEANTMDDAQAEAFNGGASEGEAKAGDPYVVVGFFVGVGETLYWDIKEDGTYKSYPNSDPDDLWGYITIRITKFDKYEVVIKTVDGGYEIIWLDFTGITVPEPEVTVENVTVTDESSETLTNGNITLTWDENGTTATGAVIVTVTTDGDIPFEGSLTLDYATGNIEITGFDSGENGVYTLTITASQATTEPISVTITAGGKTATFTVTVEAYVPSEEETSEAIAEVDFNDGNFTTGQLNNDTDTSTLLKENGVETGFTLVGKSTDSAISIAINDEVTYLSLANSATTAKASLSYTFTTAGYYTVKVSYFGNSGRYVTVLSSDKGIAEEDKTTSNSYSALITREITFQVTENQIGTNGYTVYIGSVGGGINITYIGIFAADEPAELTVESVTFDVEGDVTVEANYGNETVSAYVKMSDGKTYAAYEGVTFTWSYSEGYDTYITPTADGNAVTIAGLAVTDESGITVTVTVADNVTASFTVEVVEHEKSEQSELYVDFSELSDATSWSGDWIVSSVGNGAVGSGHLSTGGSSSDDRYIKLDLTDYQGATITIAVTVASTSSGTARSVYLSTSNNTNEQYRLAYATSSGEKATLYYTGANSWNELYLTYSGNLYIYSIDIVITEADAEQTGVTYTVEYDSASKAITVSASDGNVEGALTYEVNVSGIITVSENGTVTSVDGEEGTVTVTVKLDGRAIGSVEITVTSDTDGDDN